MDEFTVEGSTHGGQQLEVCAASGWAPARKLMFGLSLVLACLSALARAMYRVKPLEWLGGRTTHGPFSHGFNRAAQATGQA
jgi:hypothetical protein